MKKLLFYLLVVSYQISIAQIGIGTTSPHQSSILEIASNKKGFLPPRLTTTQRDLISNPAVGLLIYNLTNKCLEVNTENSINWISLCPPVINGSTNGSSNGNGLNCTAGENGTLVFNQPVSGVEQIISLNFDKLGTYDITTDTVNGVYFSAQGNITSLGNQNINLVASGTPIQGGQNTYTLNTTPNCSFTRSTTGTSLRLLSLASYSVGTTQHTQFFAQMNNAAYYGNSGIYNKISSYTYDVQASITFIDALSVQQLLNQYDVISVGYQNMTAPQATKIKQYVDQGGLLLALYDSGIGAELNAAFTGQPATTIPGGQSSVTSNNNDILNGYFGDGRNTTITGAGSYGQFLSADIPSGSTVLATNGSDYGIWTLESGNGRAVFFWDEGAFRAPDVQGTIDNTQERVLHNVMTYLFDKKY
jgi:hypothetical protein